jgi:hypothetical protein
MASHSDSDEDETFVTLGTALETVDDGKTLFMVYHLRHLNKARKIIC